MTTSAVYWNALYADGTGLSESLGHKYSAIDRNALVSFQIVGPWGLILQVDVGDGRHGRNLVWRRRRGLSHDGQYKEWQLVGWVPMGPVWAIDPLTGNKTVTDKFKVGSPLFYPPDPVEGEALSSDGLTVVKNRIIVP